MPTVIDVAIVAALLLAFWVVCWTEQQHRVNGWERQMREERWRQLREAKERERSPR